MTMMNALTEPLLRAVFQHDILIATVHHSVFGRKAQLAAEMHYPSTLKRLSRHRQQMLIGRNAAGGEGNDVNDGNSDLFLPDGSQVDVTTEETDLLEGLFDPAMSLSKRFGWGKTRDSQGNSYRSFMKQSKDIAAFCDVFLLKCIGTCVTPPPSSFYLILSTLL